MNFSAACSKVRHRTDNRKLSRYDGVVLRNGAEMNSHQLRGDFFPKELNDGVHGSNLPQAHPSCFDYQVAANGLIISTCSACLKIFASPNPSQLRMAE